MWQFSCCESRLYFYLVEQANRLGWPDNFTHSDARTSINVGVSQKSLRAAKNRLMQAGLIVFSGGGQGRADKCRYSFRCADIPPKGTPKVSPNGTPNGTPKAGDTSFIEDKPNKTIYPPYNPPEGDEGASGEPQNGGSVDTPPDPLPPLRGTPSREFVEFQRWITDNAPRVAKMKESFSEAQFSALKEAYALDFIRDLLRAMHNYEPLLKKNRSAYLTLLNWARRRAEPVLARKDPRHPSATFDNNQHYEKF